MTIICWMFVLFVGGGFIIGGYWYVGAPLITAAIILFFWYKRNP
jgi:hypothetical protein